MIYDISPPLHPGIAVWPGDTPFTLKRIMARDEGESVNLSSIEMSLHTGAHMDAPWHFDSGGRFIDEVPIEAGLGEALLFARPGNHAIGIAEVEAALREGPCERILFKCEPRRDPDEFPREFAYFSAEAAARLVDEGVRLVGIDSPSVDPVNSKELEAHRLFGKGGVTILENLLLNAVPPGKYELIALPLRLSGGDGSPVRAVLRDL